jgi:predicted nucleic acid-binding Zn ribbon protein
MRKGKPKVLVQQIERMAYVRHMILEEKKCLVCGKVFEGVKKRRYCSRACQAKANYERHADEYRKARVEKYQAEKKTARKK